MNWEYPWPPHKIWHQHIKEVQLYTPVHSSNLDHTWKVCSHLYLLPVTLWLISEFGCMVTLFASSARFKGNCWCLLTLDELIWRPYNRKESWPGIILHWTFSPPELTLMRLWVFVVEMKINHLPSEIQPKKTVGSRSLQKNVIFNYYPHHLMTLLLSYLQFLIFCLNVTDADESHVDWTTLWASQKLIICPLQRIDQIEMCCSSLIFLGRNPHIPKELK